MPQGQKVPSVLSSPTPCFFPFCPLPPTFSIHLISPSLSNPVVSFSAHLGQFLSCSKHCLLFSLTSVPLHSPCCPSTSFLWGILPSPLLVSQGLSCQAVCSLSLSDQISSLGVESLLVPITSVSSALTTVP